MSQSVSVPDPAQPDSTHAASHSPARIWTLALGSIGVVYGDIGTSPLYALKESLAAATAGGPLGETMVIGVMSLMLWALTIIVTLKYVLLIMSADNNGEGGTLSLMALLQRAMGRNLLAIALLGMAGAALFCCAGSEAIGDCDTGGVEFISPGIASHVPIAGRSGAAARPQPPVCRSPGHRSPGAGFSASGSKRSRVWVRMGAHSGGNVRARPSKALRRRHRRPRRGRWS